MLARIKKSIPAFPIKLDKKTMLILGIITAVLLMITYHVYTTYAVPRLFKKNPANMEYVREGENKFLNSLIVRFFYADWCPHSKKALVHWNSLREDEEVGNGSVVNGYKIKYELHDCSDENDANTETRLNEFKVDGFPTIKVEKGSDIIEFDAKPDYEILKKFIKAMVE